MLMKKLDKALEETLADSLKLKKDDLVERIDKYYERKKKKGLYQRFKLMSKLSAERLGSEFELLMRLKEIIFYFIFMLVVTMLALRPYSTYTSPLFTSLKNRLLDKLDFDEIVSVPQMWKYLEDLFSTAFFWEHWYYSDYPMKNNSGPDSFNYRANRLLGVPRLKQLMVRNNSCVIHSYFKRMFLRCYGQFNAHNEYKSTFGPGNGTAWIYTPPPDHASYYWGRRDWYHGGGYIQDLSYKRNKTLELVQYLQDNLWIRRGTRVVFLDWATYNVNLNLFCWFRLAFEMPPTGGILTSYSIHIIKLLRYLNPIDFVDLALEFILVGFLLYYTIGLIRDIMHYKWKYFRRFWLYIDLITLSLGYGSIILMEIRNLSLYETLDRIMKNPDKYSNLDYLAGVQVMYIYFLALLLFFTYVKVFQYLDFSTSMNQLKNTLSRCRRDVGSFAIMFFIIYIAFAVLGFLLFGMEVDTFSSVPVSTLTLLRTILVDFDYSSIDMSNRVIAPIYFISFIFLVFFVLLNMYLAIINDTYGAVKTDLKFAPESLQMLSFIKRGIHNFMLKFRCAKPGMQHIAFTNFRCTKGEILEVFTQMGISDENIKDFLKSYSIHPTNEIEQREINVLLAAVGGTLEPMAKPKEEVQEPEETDPFLKHQNRLDPIEDSITQLTQDIYRLYDVVRHMEKGGGMSKLTLASSTSLKGTESTSVLKSTISKISGFFSSKSTEAIGNKELPEDDEVSASKAAVSPESIKTSKSTSKIPTKGTEDSKIPTKGTEDSKIPTKGTEDSKKPAEGDKSASTINYRLSSSITFSDTTKPISSPKTRTKTTSLDNTNATDSTKPPDNSTTKSTINKKSTESSLPKRTSLRISDSAKPTNNTKSTDTTKPTESSLPTTSRKKSVRISASAKQLDSSKPLVHVRPSEHSRTSEDVSDLSYASLSSNFTKMAVSTKPSKACKPLGTVHTSKISSPLVIQKTSSSKSTNTLLSISPSTQVLSDTESSSVTSSIHESRDVTSSARRFLGVSQRPGSSPTSKITFSPRRLSTSDAVDASKPTRKSGIIESANATSSTPHSSTNESVDAVQPTTKSTTGESTDARTSSTPESSNVTSSSARQTSRTGSSPTSKFTFSLRHLSTSDAVDASQPTRKSGIIESANATSSTPHSSTNESVDAVQPTTKTTTSESTDARTSSTLESSNVTSSSNRQTSSSEPTGDSQHSTTTESGASSVTQQSNASEESDVLDLPSSPDTGNTTTTTSSSKSTPKE